MEPSRQRSQDTLVSAECTFPNLTESPYPIRQVDSFQQCIFPLTSFATSSELEQVLLTFVVIGPLQTGCSCSETYEITIVKD